MEACQIEGYQVCRVPMTIGRFYKVKVLYIVYEIDEWSTLLQKPWRRGVMGMYDLNKKICTFSHSKEKELL